MHAARKILYVAYIIMILITTVASCAYLHTIRMSRPSPAVYPPQRLLAWLVCVLCNWLQLGTRTKMNHFNDCYQILVSVLLVGLAGLAEVRLPYLGL